MRECYNPGFIIDNNKMNGFFFSNGGCAEHEWGIKYLNEDFGINTSLLGVDGRKITIIPERLFFIEWKASNIKRACLLYCWEDLNKQEKKDAKKYINSLRSIRTKTYSNEKEWVSAAWSREDFCIYVAGDKNVEMLKKLHEAFENKDIIMFVGTFKKGNPFDRGGLMFFINSELDESFRKNMYDEDVAEKKIQDAAAPIIKKLKAYGKEYYCCRPDWIDEKETKLRFWLNPRDQFNNYFGWVSEQDLRDWCKNKGVIPGHGRDYEKAYPDEYEKLRVQINSKIGLK